MKRTLRREIVAPYLLPQFPVFSLLPLHRAMRELVAEVWGEAL